MTCKTEFESEEGLVAFMGLATEKEADKALDLLWGLIRRTTSKQSKRRLEKLFDKAGELYEKKFDTAWIPF